MEKRCPYCGNYIDVANCDIVIRKFNNNYDPKAGWDDKEKLVYTLVELNGETSYGTGIPNESRGERYRCYCCGNLLPIGFPTLDTIVIAVVGLNRAGKTYFIGTSLPDATTSDSISRYLNGYIKDFESIEETDRILQKEYVLQEKYDATPVDVQKIPLLFRVTLGWGSLNLVVYDLSGEWFMDHSLHKTEKGFIDFLSWTDAVLFLADPTAMKDILKVPYIDDAKKQRISNGLQERGVSQIGLLRHIKKTFYHPNATKYQHLAVVVTKGDLIFESAEKLLSDSGINTDGDSCQVGGDYFDTISDLTKSFLQDANQGRIIDIADTVSSTSYHMVSAGSIPEGSKEDELDIAPHFVLDPWVATIRALTWPRNMQNDYRTARSASMSAEPGQSATNPPLAWHFNPITGEKFNCPEPAWRFDQATGREIVESMCNFNPYTGEPLRKATGNQ